MKLTYLTEWLGDQEINAICWTLIHSLWIGLIVAVLAGIIIICTRKATAKLRYRLFCSLLVLFVITIAGAAMYEQVENDDMLTDASSLISSSNQILDENQVINFPSPSLIDKSVSFLNQNAVLLFVVWFIFFLVKSAKLVIGIFYIQRIRSYKIQALSEEWLSKVQEFGAKMGIRKKVAIIQSALVKVPVAIGYFKPIIVLPIGLFFKLPIEQVETIIWHELAHIYRRDYLINILQKMIESIFFFNPAVLWLSALIREEREACCDDIVLANVQQKTNYLAVLVAFHSQGSSVSDLAMGLSLRPNQLMNRLRRMVHKENKRLSFVELSVLFAGLLMLSAFTFIPQVKPGIKNGVVYMKKTFSETLSAVASKQNQIPKLAKPFTSSTATMPNNQDTVAADTLIKFKSIRFKNSNEDKANREVNVIDGQDNRYHIIVAKDKLTLVEFNEQVVAANEFIKFENLLAQIDRIIQQKLINRSPQYIKEDINMAKKQALGWQKSAIPLNKQAFSDSLKVPIKQEVNAKSLYFSKDNTSVQVPKKKIPLSDASADRARVFGVIAFLVEHKVVANDSSIDWFALTEDQLVVNGQKQDSQLHQQLKAKYGIRPDNGLFFGPSKVHGTGIFFDKRDL
jgi:bla regulator protein BlaR1